jgi:hypothetical protein
VFSSFDESLATFGSILRGEQIANYFVKGNVHQRNKVLSPKIDGNSPLRSQAIREFQDATTPTVLMLRSGLSALVSKCFPL